MTADTNTDISDLELSSESDSTVVDEDDVAPVLPDSDSDDTDVSVTSSWSESDDNDNNTMENTIDTYIDDVQTRDARKDDRFGHICEVWDIFNNRC